MALTGIKINSGYAPKTGPQGLTWDIVLNATTTEIEKDFYQEMATLEVEFIQVAWVENQDNALPLYLDFQGLGQTLMVPPHTQGLFPVLAAAPFSVIARCAGLAEDTAIRIIFLNMPMPFYSVNYTPGP